MIKRKRMSWILTRCSHRWLSVLALAFSFVLSLSCKWSSPRPSVCSSCMNASFLFKVFWENLDILPAESTYCWGWAQDFYFSMILFSFFNFINGNGHTRKNKTENPQDFDCFQKYIYFMFFFPTDQHLITPLYLLIYNVCFGEESYIGSFGCKLSHSA